MSLSAGSRLGPYKVIAPTGAGGMSACGRSERAILRHCEQARGKTGDKRADIWAANGQRFIASQALAGSDAPITVVLNWHAALKT